MHLFIINNEFSTQQNESQQIQATNLQRFFINSMQFIQLQTLMSYLVI